MIRGRVNKVKFMGEVAELVCGSSILEDELEALPLLQHKFQGPPCEPNNLNSKCTLQVNKNELREANKMATLKEHSDTLWAGADRQASLRKPAIAIG